MEIMTMHYINLFAASFCTFVAIHTAGNIPKWFTALLWTLVVLNVGFFLLQ